MSVQICLLYVALVAKLIVANCKNYSMVFDIVAQPRTAVVSLSYNQCQQLHASNVKILDQFCTI